VYVVLDELAGDRHLAIEIGQPEAFSLAARLERDSPEGARLRRALAASPMTVGTVGM
jgi:hypothetical protein